VQVGSWALTEVIRYSFYALGRPFKTPRFLSWLRYSTFYVLYPIGGTSEALLIYVALPTVRARRMWEISLPNRHNFAFSYYYFLWAFMLLYVYGARASPLPV
jgi:very-long-chain (3R)-3-hydroxyacyl-CoA dehydratase